MSYRDSCTQCHPLPACTILRDAGPADSCCGRCGARTRLLYVPGTCDPEQVGSLLLPRDYHALAQWALDHPDEVEAQLFTPEQRRRLRFVKWLRETDRVEV